MLDSVCDADENACVQRGSVRMSSSNSNDDTQYFIYKGGSDTIKGQKIDFLMVKRINKETGSSKFVKKVYPGKYTINNKDLVAWDLRPYTQGSFTLNIDAGNIVILTFYPGNDGQETPSFGNVLSINM